MKLRRILISYTYAGEFSVLSHSKSIIQLRLSGDFSKRPLNQE